MVRIVNKKKDVEILIDDTLAQVTFTPLDYEEIPYVKIELKGFDFHRHTFNCKECKTFIDSFGTDTLDWFIEYNGKRKRLDLLEFGPDFSQNHSVHKIAEFQNGSLLKLNLSLLPNTRDGIEELLEEDIKLENYERCCIWKSLLEDFDS